MVPAFPGASATASSAGSSHHQRHEFANIAPSRRGDGGTGRRARLRIWFRKKWGFESPSPHCNQFGKLGPMDLVSSGRWASDPPPDPPLFPSVLVPMTMRTVAGDNGFGWLTQAARESRLVAQGADVLGAECALADTMPTWLAALISGGTGAEAGAEYSCVTFCRAHRCRYRVCRAAWARRPVRVF
jgi:hypothetical protein